MQYAYFLIKLYKVCNKFENLKYTAFSTTKLKNNFSDLIQFMENDLSYWSPPPNVTTPLSNISTKG